MNISIASTSTKSFIFLIQLILLFIVTAAAAATTTTPTATYIETKCQSTSYPALCISSLTPYASQINTSPRNLAETALVVSLDRARCAKARVTYMAKTSTGLTHREMVALKDCKEEMSDTVEKLQQSLHELRRAGEVAEENEEEFGWRMSNVETWVSAGLTDDGTCADGFSERGMNMNGEVKNSIRKQMVEVEQLTSNALAFINQYANDQHF